MICDDRSFVSVEEEEINRPQYMSVPYTDYNPLNLKTYEDNVEINLMTYRYRVPDGVLRKGVVFYFHGFGGYCESTAYAFKLLADKGYETIAMDMRGFGNSGGSRGCLISTATIYNDYDLLISETIKKYSLDPSTTPLFLLGFSFGGLLSYHLALKYGSMIKGMCLIAPFFDASYSIFKQMGWLIKTINFFNPKFQCWVPSPDEDYRKKYSYIFDDPKMVFSPRVQCFEIFLEMQEYVNANIDKAKTPILILTAGKDTVVSNTACYTLINQIDNPQNSIKEYPESDHMTIFLEYDEVVNAISEMSEYFDKLLLNGEEKL